jgi:hypothetical protein
VSQRSRYARPKEIVHVRARLRNFWTRSAIVRTRVLIEQAANNLQSAPQHVHVTHLARLDMTEHSAISERSTGLHRYAKITPPTSSQDRDSKLWITQRGQLVVAAARSPAVLNGWRSATTFQTGAPELDDLRARSLGGRPYARLRRCRMGRLTP